MIILTVLGARPQFIKAAPVWRALNKAGGIRQILVHTGQHYDDRMSEIFFRELDLPKPDLNLGVGSGSHGHQTGRMLERLEEFLLRDKPDRVLVYGDTNSTLAGALAAAKLNIPVAHVEAGLRSYNRRMPEEINRVLADHCSDILFAPTPTAVNNLAREGIAAAKAHLVGDVMYDAALLFGDKAERQSRILEELGLRPREYALATVHRAENTDDPMRLSEVWRGVQAMAQRLPVIFPVHPRTRDATSKARLDVGAAPGLRVIAPVGYLDMIRLVKNARLIATDSGGLQKEAFIYRVPCVTLRDETEWVETVEQGGNRLVGASASRLAVAVADVLAGPATVQGATACYGDGNSAGRIVSVLTA